MLVTWYVLEDGSVADPSDVAPDNAGKLWHKSGKAVAMRGEVPSTRGVYPGQMVKVEEPEPVKPKRTYKTRESKAE